MSDLVRYLPLRMVFKDAPEHTRLRRLTSNAFHNRSMQAMQPQVEEITAWLIERIGSRREFDYIAEFAGPLPCLVIMAMLGVPRNDLALVKRWSDGIALFIGSSRMSSEKYAAAQDVTQAMAAYFLRQIEARRRSPANDLMSALLALEDEGDRFSDDELVASCIL